jgi:hypothetical protein
MTGLSLIILNLGVSILLRILDQVQGFSSNATTISIVIYYFIQIISYMFRSYDYLQAEGCTSEIKMTCLALIILNLVDCILLRVLDQVQGIPSNATLFQ